VKVVIGMSPGAAPRNQIRELVPVIEPIVPHLSIVPEVRMAGEWYGNYRKGQSVRDAYAAIVGKVIR
jgi:chromosome partitioning protein